MDSRVISQLRLASQHIIKKHDAMRPHVAQKNGRLFRELRPLVPISDQDLLDTIVGVYDRIDYDSQLVKAQLPEFEKFLSLPDQDIENFKCVFFQELWLGDIYDGITQMDAIKKLTAELIEFQPKFTYEYVKKLCLEKLKMGKSSSD